MALKLRAAARAIVLDEEDRVLLCRFVQPHPAVPDGTPAVWSTPGGGIEPGEDGVTALRRELLEETGLIAAGDVPHVWHQTIAASQNRPGVGELVNDYFLVRTAHFEPHGTFSEEQLAGELIGAFRWWRLPEIKAYAGPDLFSPRDLAGPLADLLTSGIPAEPVALGL